MRQYVQLAVAAALLAALAGGCRQEVISETYTPLGPSFRPGNDLAAGRAKAGVVMVPQPGTAPAARSDGDPWDWLMGLFDDDPPTPTPAAAPASIPTGPMTIQPSAMRPAPPAQPRVR